MQTKTRILRRLLQSGCVVVGVGLFSSMRGAEPEPSRKPALHSRDVTTAVQKALPYLWEEGERWIDERDCVSCHQVPLMVWSLNTAKDSGFAVDTNRLQGHKQWSVRPESFDAPEEGESFQLASALKGNTDTMSMLLLGLGGNGVSDAKWEMTFSDALIANQNKNGLWDACGQLPAQKRPLEETNRVSSMWVVLALLRQGHDMQEFDIDSSLFENTSAVSTECCAAHLLLAEFIDTNTLQERTKELLDRQKTDGGWGWISEQPSDALATGIALYALRAAGEAAGLAAALKAGDQFLVQTQLEDGSWRVPGTKRKADNQPTETANYWGTAWAVVGLLEK